MVQLPKPLYKHSSEYQYSTQITISVPLHRQLSDNVINCIINLTRNFAQAFYVLVHYLFYILVGSCSFFCKLKEDSQKYLIF